MHSARLSEVLQFALNIAGMTGIRPYFIESSSVVGSILCQTRKERLGEAAITIDTLDTDIRLWLARKVFGEDDDIDKIQILGGSLTRGLLMVLHALPRRNVGEQVKPLSRRPHHSEGLGVKRVRVHESFDSENFKKMKEMVQNCVQKREKAIAERLSSLPIDIPESVKLRSIGKGQPQMTTTIGSFLQLGDEEAESVTEMQSWLAHRQSEAMVLNQELLSSEDNKHNLMSTSSCEARVEDLAPLMDNAITTGFLDSAIDPAPSLGDTSSNRIS